MRFYGKIGFRHQGETFAHSGIWEDTVIEKYYYGDIQKMSIRDQANNDSINNNVVLSHQVTIVADPFVTQNYQDILYAEIEGAKWRVTYVENVPPRLRLTIGGKYNG